MFNIGIYISFVCFETSHSMSHKAIPEKSFFYKIKIYHKYHHSNPVTNFGFTTPSYDYLFGTINKDSQISTLKLILGSHKWPKLIQPTKWSNDKPWYKNKKDFMEMPSIETLNNEIMIPELKLGDAVLFNFKIVHGASGNNSQERRRAFSMRFIGDDVRYKDRGGETSPPFAGINLKSGDTLRTDWFPVVWSR